jgi:hypothetical protein
MMPNPQKVVQFDPSFCFFGVNHQLEGSMMIAKLVILTCCGVWNHQLEGSIIIENDVRPQHPESPLYSISDP